MSKIKASLCIEIDSYAGNVERELCGYLFGFCDEHGDHIAKAAIKDWLDNVSDLDKGCLDDFIHHRSVDEYGLMPYEIYWPDGAKDCSGIEFFVNEEFLSEEDEMPEWRGKVLDYIKRRIGPDMTIVLPKNGDVLRKNPFPVKIQKMFWKVDTISTEEISII